MGLEGKAEKTKYVFVCCEKNKGTTHNIKVCNKSLEMLGDFKYRVITLINKKYIHDKIELF